MLTRILICLFIGFISCNKKQEENINSFLNAEVLHVADLNCRLPVISFIEDSIAIRSVMNQTALLYVAQNLPEQYKVIGMKIKIAVSKVPDDESRACRTLGPTLPHIKILKVQEP